MPNLLFIFNPYSGKGQIKSYLLDITDIFTKAGYKVTVRPTQAPLDAYEYIRLHAKEYDRIVISGGDGTLNEAVKGLMTFDAKKRCPLGYIPAGTTNDFASTLNIPKNMLEAAKIAVDGIPFKCDIGCFNGKFFNYVAAFGAFTDVSYDTPQGTKNMLGHAAYVLEAIKRLPSLPSYNVKIKFNGGEIEENVALCIVLNATSVGGIQTGGKLADISLNDGLFELIVLKYPDSIIDIQSSFSSIMKGEQTGKGYMMLKSSKFEFISNREIKWTLDGEYGGNPSDAVIEVVPSAITYIVDKEPDTSALNASKKNEE